MRGTQRWNNVDSTLWACHETTSIQRCFHVKTLNQHCFTFVCLARTLREMDILSRKVTLSWLLWLSFTKESTLKCKNVLPIGANQFLLVKILFQKRFGCARKPGTIHKRCRPLKLTEISVKCIQLYRFYHTKYDLWYMNAGTFKACCRKK